MFRRFAAPVAKILRSNDGVVAIQMALTLTALLGMAGLATDVGLVMYKQRQMQAAADAAAFSAALDLASPNTCSTSTAYKTEALAVAGQNGFVNGANGIAVTTNCPPVSPAADAGNTSAVQVVIQQSQSPLLSSVVFSGSFNVSAQAVASTSSSSSSPPCNPAANPNAKCTCILQTSKTANPGISIGNGATLNMTSCGMEACSTSSSQAILMNGGSTITTQGITSAGAMSFSAVTVKTATNTYSNIPWGGSCPSSVCAQNTACAANADPYAAQVASLSLPPSGCSLGSGKNYAWAPSAYTLNPGVWCNGVTFGNGMTYNLNPGVYYVNAGTFNVGGGATLNGTGVTIVLTGSGANYANVDIGNGATVNLSAPASNATSGIAFLGDPNGPLSDTNTFQGGSKLNIDGAIYFPSESVVFNNGASTNSTSCTQVVAGSLSLQGGMSFNSNCANSGTSNLGGGVTTSSTSLVE
jgi:Flp pilus assembly protein TadG